MVRRSNLGNKPIQELELGMRHEDDKWIVYKALERGKINDIMSFDNESDACDLILNTLKRYKKRDESLNW